MPSRWTPRAVRCFDRKPPNVRSTFWLCAFFVRYGRKSEREREREKGPMKMRRIRMFARYDTLQEYTTIPYETITTQHRKTIIIFLLNSSFSTSRIRRIPLLRLLTNRRRRFITKLQNRPTQTIKTKQKTTAAIAERNGIQERTSNVLVDRVVGWFTHYRPINKGPGDRRRRGR